MLIKLVCFLLGHRMVHKAYTGESMEAINYLGGAQTVALYKWTTTDFCTRCGKKEVVK